MVQFNLSQRELTLKVVYYGPALSGKTTNLQAIHRMVPRKAAGRLMTLETRDDRTLFFDLLPVFMKTRHGYRVKLKLYTVPGQVIHDSTRRVVLQGADAVAFIADSQLTETDANKVSFGNLRENLSANGLDMDTLPLVIQFNKRDLPETRTEEELRVLEKRRKTPIYRSIAIHGDGVLETLRGLVAMTWDHLDDVHALASKRGVARDEFLQELFSGWNPARIRGGGVFCVGPCPCSTDRSFYRRSLSRTSSPIYAVPTPTSTAWGCGCTTPTTTRSSTSRRTGPWQTRCTRSCFATRRRSGT